MSSDYVLLGTSVNAGETPDVLALAQDSGETVFLAPEDTLKPASAVLVCENYDDETELVLGTEDGHTLVLEA